MQWDGKLYEPQRFGEGPKAGTVDWAKRERQRHADRRYYDRVLDDRKAEQPAPARSNLVFWPLVLVWRLIQRIWRSA